MKKLDLENLENQGRGNSKHSHWTRKSAIYCMVTSYLRF